MGLAGGSYSTYGYANAEPVMLGDLLGLAASCPNNDRCAQLRKQIFAKSVKLLYEIGKYDPIADGRGGVPTFGGKATSSGGQHNKILELQQGLKNDIAEYKRLCSNDNHWPLPRSIDDAANRSVPEPLIIPEPGLPDQPSSNQSTTIGVGGALLILLQFLQPCSDLARHEWGRKSLKPLLSESRCVVGRIA